MANALRAIDYLKAPQKHPAAAVSVVFGDEPFFKRQALVRLRQGVLGGGEADFSLAVFQGPEAAWRDVLEELSTLAMFGGKRLAMVEEADDFVSRYRGELEAYVAKPKGASVLLLEVKSWPSNTRLYKAVDAAGLAIDCTALKAAQVPAWLVSWAKQAHGLQLPSDGAELLLEMIGPELGLLDQELAKLAVSAPAGGKINEEMIAQLVAWRARTTWDMLDAALEGNLPKTLAELDRLLLAGENAIAILAQVAGSLRRLAAATRLVVAAEAAGRRMTLRDALQQAGVNRFYLDKSERQLRRLGRDRGARLYDWLLEADLDLKGASRLEPQTVLERLLVRIAMPAPQSART